MKNTWPSWGASVRKLVPNADDLKSRTGKVGAESTVGPRKTPARNPDESLRIPARPPKELMSVGKEALPSGPLKTPRLGVKLMVPDTLENRITRSGLAENPFNAGGKPPPPPPGAGGVACPAPKMLALPLTGSETVAAEAWRTSTAASAVLLIRIFICRFSFWI